VSKIFRLIFCLLVCQILCSCSELIISNDNSTRNNSANKTENKSENNKGNTSHKLPYQELISEEIDIAPPNKFDFCYPKHQVRVSDGDTVSIKSTNQKSLRVRFIGIDAPEKGQAPHGKQATEYLKKLINNSPSEDICCEKGHEPKDKYGRNLAYCWAGSKMLNAEMVKSGNAITLFIGKKNNQYKEIMLVLEEEAEEAELGIHNPNNLLPETPYEWRKRQKKIHKH
jgi:micrococcal nuclease